MSKGQRELTQKEIDGLKYLKGSYIKGKLRRAVTLIVSISGFCIATLSIEKIPEKINFWVSFFVLLVLLIILLFTKFNKDPLRLELSKLYQECGNHKGSKHVLDEMNVWVGFQEDKREIWLPVLFSAMFVIYTLVELAIKAFGFFGL